MVSGDYAPSVVDYWIGVLLQVTAEEVNRNGARPTIISRNVYIAVSSMYQAWAAYDGNAVGTEFGSEFRRPLAERTESNRATAISYAAYRGMLSVYDQPADATVLRSAMVAKGLDPDSTSTDPSTGTGVGNRAAAAVIASRRHDRSNQFGDEAGSNGTSYSDTTGYVALNTETTINDPDHWQPIRFTFPDGTSKVPGYLTPHWGKVKPFALVQPDQFRPAGPPKVGSRELALDVQQVVHENANLSLEKKAIVEFMRDGPQSTSQSGQWLTFARIVARRDQHDLDTDMKMYFAMAAVGLDAFIASWEAKRYYDSSRPWTLVRHLYAGGRLLGWGGPGRGTITLPTDRWHPYSPAPFVTPPFPGFVSGHSTVSGATARLLELFTGSDIFGHHEDWTVGSLTEVGFPCNAIQQVEGRPVPPTDLECRFTLAFPTFTSVAEMAGISRIYGGFHIQTDNIEGLAMGRKIALHHWPIIQSYFTGGARNGIGT